MEMLPEDGADRALVVIADQPMRRSQPRPEVLPRTGWEAWP